MASTAQNSLEPLRSADAKKEEDYEDELDYSPFYGIEKSAVLQEARIFNDAHVDARKCQQAITRLLYLLTQGETLTKKESSDIFFSVTKLFQNSNSHLRRLVYLAVKTIGPSPEEAFMIINTLMKDMGSPSELVRANALRVLVRITDPQLVLQVERQLKQALVDGSPVVVSSALCAGVHLCAESADVVRRWGAEIAAAVASPNAQVAFHGVALSHALRARDRAAAGKLAAQLARGGGSRSPLAQMLLVRYAAQAAGDAPPADGSARPGAAFLEQCLRHRSEAVVFEAARAIANLRGATPRELAPAVSVLQLFLSSGKPVLRFAAARALHRVAGRCPAAVADCTLDLEALVADPNRGTATLAVIALLRAGGEAGVPRTLKQISGFLADAADEHRAAVVEAVRSLCEAFPSQHRALLAFLSQALREDGGHDAKRAVVDAISALVRAAPESRDAALATLAEFIEDCEYGRLAAHILRLLAREAPRSSHPARLLRHVANRVALEAAPVRAAAVAALGQLGAELPELRPRAAALVERALGDDDDEVRDRAVAALATLRSLAPGTPDAREARRPRLCPDPKGLHEAVAAYLEDDGDAQGDFDLALVAAAAPAPEDARLRSQGGLAAAVAADDAAAARGAGPGGAAGAGAAGGAQGGAPGGAASASEAFAAAKARVARARAELARQPALAGLGAPLAVAPARPLTEDETEYRVDVSAIALADKLVLAFRCFNTVAEQIVEDVRPTLDLAQAPDGFVLDAVVPLERMPERPASGDDAFVPTDAKAPEELAACSAYAVLSRPAAGPPALASLPARLRFRSREVDPATGEAEEEGYEDEYELEPVELAADAYLVPEAPHDVDAAYDRLPAASEVVDEYDLGPRDDLAQAVRAVLTTLALEPANPDDARPSPAARSHVVKLAGELAGAGKFCAKVAFGVDAHGSVAMRIEARGETEHAAQAVHAVVQQA